MNIYISCDMEGVDGTVTEKQSSPTGPFYAFAREQIMGEVNAAAQGAFDAGASSVLVNDSHWDQTNLLPEKLDPRIEYITGSGKPLAMMQGVDTGMDAVFFHWISRSCRHMEFYHCAYVQWLCFAVQDQWQGVR